MWIHLADFHLCFLEQSINTVFEEPEKRYFDLIEAYADKENIMSSKSERSFLKNFFEICEFISQSYKLCLKKQFANTLFVESAKWDLGAYWGPWW